MQDLCDLDAPAANGCDRVRRRASVEHHCSPNAMRNVRRVGNLGVLEDAAITKRMTDNALATLGSPRQSNYLAGAPRRYAIQFSEYGAGSDVAGEYAPLKSQEAEGGNLRRYPE
jgi:hypothetical protein